MKLLLACIILVNKIHPVPFQVNKRKKKKISSLVYYIPSLTEFSLWTFWQQILSQLLNNLILLMIYFSILWTQHKDKTWGIKNRKLFRHSNSKSINPSLYKLCFENLNLHGKWTREKTIYFQISCKKFENWDIK